MPKSFSDAVDVQSIASGLIPNHHPELATARIRYVFVDKASSKGGLSIPGKVRKLSGMLEWMLEHDFIIEVAQDKWQELDHLQHTALVDHLLERCTSEEDEQSGDITWKVREPEVQEFASILGRYGAWHTGLHNFVSVAQATGLESIAEEETEEVDLAESLTTADLS